MSDWKNTPEVVTEDMHGFVYLFEIQCPETFEWKKYIGCKRFWSTRTLPPLKGKKHKRKITKESNWKIYTTSSPIVKEWLEEGTNFKKTILRVVYSQWELNYVENKIIMLSDACLKDEYLNGVVNLRQSNPPKKLKEDYIKGLTDFDFEDIKPLL